MCESYNLLGKFYHLSEISDDTENRSLAVKICRHTSRGETMRCESPNAK